MTIPTASAIIVERHTKLTAKHENPKYPGNPGFHNMMPLDIRKNRGVLRTTSSIRFLLRSRAEIC